MFAQKNLNLMSPKSFLLLGIGCAVGFWLFDTLIDFLFFEHNHRSYWEALFGVSGREAYMRLLVSLLFFFLCLFYFLYATKNNELHRDLVASLDEELIKSDDRLRINEERLRLAQEATNQGWFDVDLKSEAVNVSPSYVRLIGYEPDTFNSDLQTWRKNLHPNDLVGMEKAFKECLHNGGPVSFEWRRKKCNGDWIWIRSIGKIVSWGPNHEPLRMIGTHTDMTEQKSAENELRISAIAFQSQQGMMVTDADKVIIRVNKAFTTITGYNAEEVIGHNPRLLSSGRHDGLFYESMWQEINTTDYWEGEVWNKHKNSDVYLEKLTITAVKDSAGIIVNYVATITDITLSKQAEQKIADLAYYDPLTHLPNRRLMLDRIQHAMARGARSGKEGALLFLDLDNFKTLNDTLGHDMGDLLLQQVAERLTSCMREGDTVSRFGGDEFVVLVEGLSAQPIEAAIRTEDIANKILSSINKPFQLVNKSYTCSISIGITLFNDHQSEVEELLKQADIALYQAKDDGRNALCFFDPQMQENIIARAELEEDLNQAIKLQQFQLYYQIQMDRSDHPIGAEALIRWFHPERGLISPVDFIPLAEQNGTILAIGQWVLDTACAQLKTWQQELLTQDLTLSVNVSAKQFHQDVFVEQMLATVARHDINPTRLKLELTETMLVDNINDIIIKMDTLSKIGIKFSLDDFGTGYSSLQYLKRLPLNQLKIDKSFVDDIVSDSNDQAIVRTIIAMAHSMELSVIAEGVETTEQQQRLLEEGCKHYQGYLYSEPVPILEFEALLGTAD